MGRLYRKGGGRGEVVGRGEMGRAAGQARDQQELGLCCRELKGPRWRSEVRASWLLNYLGTDGYRDQE